MLDIAVVSIIVYISTLRFYYPGHHFYLHEGIIFLLLFFFLIMTNICLLNSEILGF